ncbi:hypothetical protein Pmani_011643 [Petrolisthes manimaculis]|uniref:MADF domain-containing protein n=1 Tax=Petrolisthes manimaculis TaxID=1843537 RepID=A0AAE1UFZ3_9EUCA|nr:hypothetical protein Pmani_011643 [Petrolisthes manimaculis]
MDKLIHWSHDAIISLLEKVREKEPLWNPVHPHYHKKSLKQVLYTEICKELQSEYPELQDITTAEVLKKFTYLRGNFQKHWRKINCTPKRLTRTCNSQVGVFFGMLLPPGTL